MMKRRLDRRLHELAMEMQNYDLEDGADSPKFWVAVVFHGGIGVAALP